MVKQRDHTHPARPAPAPALVVFNKPFLVLSQFTPEGGKTTLAEWIHRPDVRPAGRLDHDSEGLLLLTNLGPLHAHIADPAHKMPKTYWVQVEGVVDDTALRALAAGVMLNDGLTLPADVHRIAPPDLWVRTPPIRERRHIPTDWLSLTIREGRNRQVRRMTAAVGHPTLRLIRVAVGPWSLDGLLPGEHRTLQAETLKQDLGESVWRRLIASAMRRGDPSPGRQPNGRTPGRARVSRTGRRS